MSNEYRVTIYFKNKPSEEKAKEYETRLNRAYYKDAIDEDHTSLQCEQTEEEERAGVVPDFETAFKRHLEEEKDGGRVVGIEELDDGLTWEVYFTGWECCRDAVRSEARKIMEEER